MCSQMKYLVLDVGTVKYFHCLTRVMNAAVDCDFGSTSKTWTQKNEGQSLHRDFSYQF